MMRKSVIVVIIGVLIGVLNEAQGSYPAGQEKKVCSKGGFFIESAGELLSVDIRDGVLKEVLHEISEQQGITFLIADTLGGEKVMARFSQIKLDKGLSKILKDYNCIYLYDQGMGGGSDALLVKLKEVRVYPRVSQGKQLSFMTIAKGVQLSASVAKEKAPESTKKDTDVDSLVSGLKDADSKVRMEAVRELNQIGGEKAVAPLAHAVKDWNRNVSQEAKKALTDIGKGFREEDKALRQELGGDEEEALPPEEMKGKADLSLSGSGDNYNVGLSNDVPVKGVQFTVEGALPAEVRTTERSEGFVASFDKAHRRVLLWSAGGKTIAPGNGPIVEMVCSSNSGSVQLSEKKISDAKGNAIKK